MEMRRWLAASGFSTMIALKWLANNATQDNTTVFMAAGLTSKFWILRLALIRDLLGMMSNFAKGQARLVVEVVERCYHFIIAAHDVFNRLHVGVLLNIDQT
jgi:hypothetical protein